MTRTFAHLSAENSACYRAVLDRFVAAKERYRLHLRPEELWAELEASDAAGWFDGPEQVQQQLRQLEDWGNLIATHDSAEVRTVEEFNRARFLYQLSREGEAAEAALAVFRERIADPGALQTAALGDIVDHLQALVALVRDPLVDAARIHQTCSQLFARFDGLAEQARAFLASLRRSLDLRGAGVDDFLAYKEHLVGYVERFLRELTVLAGAIVEAIMALEAAGVDGWLDRAADRDLSDELRQDAEARAARQARWRWRWAGLRSWFLGDGERPAQYTELRAHTRTALTGLLQALAAIHDARLRRSDRVADLRCLARWFATAADDAAMHALYRQSFLLAPGRHLMVNDATLDAREQEPVAPATSWLDAPPMVLAPQLRKAGRLRQGPGKAAVVLEHGLAKAAMHRRLAAEAAALARARAAIATGRVTRLSELEIADPLAFGVLLECLGAVLSQRTDPTATIDTVSGDGSLRVRCVPVVDAPEMVLPVPDGSLRGPDLELVIEEAWA